VRASQDLQDVAAVAVMDAALASARGLDRDALREARAAFDQVHAVGISTEFVILAWSLAIRTALYLGDRVVLDELLVKLDGYPPGHVPPLLRAERNLARARLSAEAAEPDADAALAAAVDQLRAVGSPYHLAQGLLDRADHLAQSGRDREAAVLRDEARAIGERLAAPVLLERAGLGVEVDAG
jgi:hypothetical protein